MPLTHCHSTVSTLNDDCQCHSLGSLGPKCDIDGNCRCRAGVGGAKCDHCLPGFWGLHLIALGQQSCQPCGCSAFGSSRADCEQSTGRCECWRGASGDRCERCTTDLVMTASGCVPKQEYRTPASCSSLECHHGAKCVQSVGELPDCECPEHCDMSHLGIVASMSVCGSDGTTYENMCQLLKFACKHQLDLVAVSLGICFQDSTEPRERRNRNKETSIEQLGTECKPDSIASSTCKCPPGEIVDNGRCLSDVNSLLSLNLDGQRIYQLEKQDFQLPMNVSITIWEKRTVFP